MVRTLSLSFDLHGNILNWIIEIVFLVSKYSLKRLPSAHKSLIARFSVLSLSVTGLGTKSLSLIFFNYSLAVLFFLSFSMKRSHQDDEETIAVGYVTSYTPLKQGTNHFFFDFQTSPQEVKRSICFDNTKITIIQDYLHLESPVKLRNIVFQDTDSKYLAQIKLNARTIITTANNCQIEFNQKSQSPLTMAQL